MKNIETKLKDIAVAKSRLAELETSAAAELNRELATLPGKYGFATPKAFIKAVKVASAGPSGVGKPKRTRAVITDAIRQDVARMVAIGWPGSRMAKALKISLPTVQNIKKALGLVKARKAVAK